jgi:hypothetical protein
MNIRTQSHTPTRAHSRMSWDTGVHEGLSWGVCTWMCACGGRRGGGGGGGGCGGRGRTARSTRSAAALSAAARTGPASPSSSAHSSAAGSGFSPGRAAHIRTDVRRATHPLLELLRIHVGILCARARTRASHTCSAGRTAANRGTSTTPAGSVPAAVRVRAGSAVGERW